MEKETKGSAIALLPIAVFLVIFLGSGFITGDFYSMPAIVGFLIALLVAFVQDRKHNFNEKIHIIAQGVGEDNIITMSLIFLRNRAKLSPVSISFLRFRLSMRYSSSLSIPKKRLPSQIFPSLEAICLR